jgi:hypothetical protein
MKRRLTLFLALLVAALPLHAGIKIKGSNGNEVEFSALFDAKPDGLIALLNPDSTAMTVPWAKIDLDTLKTSQPEVYKAYEKAVATNKPQPLGMGIASEMLSLSQLPPALKQAVKDPYDWVYWGYSYQTVITESDGQTVTRVYRTEPVRYPAGYISSNTPFVLLKRLRDVKDDKSRKELLANFRYSYGYYGVNTMLERIDYTINKLPSAKVFPRDTQTTRLIFEADRFRKTVEQLQTAESFTQEHQSVIKTFFTLLDID